VSYYIQAVLFTVIVFMRLPLYFSWCKRLENRDLYRRHLEAYNKAFNVFLDSSIFFSVSITEIAIMATSNDAYSRIIGIQLIMLELIPGLCLCTIRNDRFVMALGSSGRRVDIVIHYRWRGDILQRESSQHGVLWQ